MEFLQLSIGVEAIGLLIILSVWSFTTKPPNHDDGYQRINRQELEGSKYSESNLFALHFSTLLLSIIMVFWLGIEAFLSLELLQRISGIVLATLWVRCVTHSLSLILSSLESESVLHAQTMSSTPDFGVTCSCFVPWPLHFSHILFYSTNASFQPFWNRCLIREEVSCWDSSCCNSYSFSLLVFGKLDYQMKR